MQTSAIVVGDHVRIVKGIAFGFGGRIVRTSRQGKHPKKAIFWVETSPGEEHAFFRDEIEWTGEHTKVSS